MRPGQIKDIKLSGDYALLVDDQNQIEVISFIDNHFSKVMPEEEANINFSKKHKIVDSRIENDIILILSEGANGQGK